MRAITVNSPNTVAALREDLPAPTPADNEVLVRVHASAANPVDNSIAAGLLAQMGVEYEYPVVLGRDYAGVVEQTGAAVTGYQPGDQVFGFVLHANPTARAGAWAELITVTEELSIAPAPEGVDLALAGARPGPRGPRPPARPPPHPRRRRARSLGGRRAAGPRRARRGGQPRRPARR